MGKLQLKVSALYGLPPQVPATLAAAEADEDTAWQEMSESLREATEGLIEMALDQILLKHGFTVDEVARIWAGQGEALIDQVRDEFTAYALEVAWDRLEQAAGEQ